VYQCLESGTLGCWGRDSTLFPCFNEPMTICLPLVLGAVFSVGSSCPEAGDGSYLYQPSFSMDYELRQPAVPYIPEAGDLFLATDDGFFAKVGHKFAFSGAPHHSGIVFVFPDGRMGLLEGGPQNTLHCQTLDLVPELQAYAVKERVWIRKRLMPLCPDQSARLTAFAMASEGKRFALL